MTDFLPFYLLEQVKSLPFQNPEAWKRCPFRAEPPLPSHCREYPPPPVVCTWKIALKYKVKQNKNGKFTSSYKASPIDFETQISHRR